MPITVDITTRDNLPVATAFGYEVTADLTFDTDYASSGGESLDPHSDLLFPKETTVRWAGCTSSGGFVFEYDITNKKIIAYMQTDADNGVPLGEVTTGLDALAGIVCHLRAVATV